MKDDFNKNKNTVIEIIQNHKNNEITNETRCTSSGVYMIYVDNFDDDKIIPFYIGQTNNFQERHKQHFSEILALNRLDKSCYEYALSHGLYSGQYRACKIFAYMVNHHCKLKDFHMIVLDEIKDEDERFEKEYEYIDTLRASIFGFNQLNCVTKYMELESETCSKDDYAAIVAAEVEDLIKYKGYGYYAFNLYVASSLLDQVQELTAELTDSQEFKDILINLHRLSEIRHKLIELQIDIRNMSNSEVWNSCRRLISDYFKRKGLKSKKKQELIIDVLVYDLDSRKKELTQYFKRYIKQNTEELFDMIYQAYGNMIYEAKETLQSKQDEYRKFESEREAISKAALNMVMSNSLYKSHPLKDFYKPPTLENYLNLDNGCYINIEYTCFKSDYHKDIYPVISKIDYLVCKVDSMIRDSVFLETGLENFFETDKVYYYESGFRKGPFNPFLVGNVDTHIPVSMEYRNGINEYTLCQHKVKDICSVFEEVDKLIDKQTKVIYTTSGYKSTIERFAYIPKIEDLTIIKKLKKEAKIK